MELDKTFQFAVIQAWEDLMKTDVPCLVRVEYQCEPGAPLDYVSIWLVRDGGYQELVCDYWTSTTSAHPSGVRFRDTHHSEQLTEALDFIMKNQDQFTRPPDACRNGLVLIYPPTEDEQSEAGSWMRRSRDPGSRLNPVAVSSHRAELSAPSIYE